MEEATLVFGFCVLFALYMYLVQYEFTSLPSDYDL